MSSAMNHGHQTAITVVQGYCVHCRIRRQMNGAIQVCNRRGGRDLKGHCNVCGKAMYRLGGWDSVAAQVAQQTRETLNIESNVELNVNRNVESAENIQPDITPIRE